MLKDLKLKIQNEEAGLSKTLENLDSSTSQDLKLLQALQKKYRYVRATLPKLIKTPSPTKGQRRRPLCQRSATIRKGRRSIYLRKLKRMAVDRLSKRKLPSKAARKVTRMNAPAEFGDKE